MNKNNFDVIQKMLESNENLRRQYVMSLFSDLLEEKFLPLLRQEQKDLGVYFSNSLICEAIVNVLKEDLEIRPIVVRKNDMRGVSIRITSEKER